MPHSSIVRTPTNATQHATLPQIAWTVAGVVLTVTLAVIFLLVLRHTLQAQDQYKLSRLSAVPKKTTAVSLTNDEKEELDHYRARSQAEQTKRTAAKQAYKTGTKPA